MPKAYENILVASEDGVTTITMNRPEVKNALNPALIQEMHQVLDEIAMDETARVVILTGTGDSFTSGADLRSFGGGRQGNPDRQEGYRNYHGWIDLLEKVRLFPMSTIAAVNGWALGWGFNLAMVCDFTIVANEAGIGIPEMSYDDGPAGGTIKSLLTYFPYKKAVYYLITGEIVTGAEAEKWGIATKVVPRTQILEESNKLAAVMKAHDPMGVWGLKLKIWKELYQPFAEAVQSEGANPSTLKKPREGSMLDHMRSVRQARRARTG